MTPTDTAPADGATKAVPSTTVTTTVVTPRQPGPPLPQSFLAEVDDLCKVCDTRYHFNSRLDNFLNILGIVVSLAIIAAGLWHQSELSALLGGLVAAVVSAQRAFPFNQRWQFYRTLNEQTKNLRTEAVNGMITLDQGINTLKGLRLDFAQQIPRGSNFRGDTAPDGSATGLPSSPPPSAPAPSAAVDTPPAAPAPAPAPAAPEAPSVLEPSKP